MLKQYSLIFQFHRVKTIPLLELAVCTEAPSSPSPEQTDAKLAELILNIADTHKGDLLIVGNFNLLTITWKDQFPYVTSDTVNPIIDMIHDTCLHQIVDQLTRFMSRQLPSLLDLIFLRRPESLLYTKYMPPIGKSDHVAIEIKTTFLKVTNSYIKRTFIDYQKIRMDLSNISWDDVLIGSLEQPWQCFKELLLNKAEQYTSSKLIPKPRTLPTMTTDIKKEINQKTDNGRSTKSIYPWKTKKNFQRAETDLKI